jgi:hypothetical protein
MREDGLRGNGGVGVGVEGERGRIGVGGDDGMEDVGDELNGLGGGDVSIDAVRQQVDVEGWMIAVRREVMVMTLAEAKVSRLFVVVSESTRVLSSH